MIRILYFFYYIRQLDWKLFKKFSKHVSVHHRIPKYRQYLGILVHSIRYNISILEYYQFQMYSCPKEEKSSWAGTGFMYEFQKRMNPPSVRVLLSDKLRFLASYKEFISHQFISLAELVKEASVKQLLEENDQLVLKHSLGQCGQGIQVISSNGQTRESLIRALEDSGNDFIEAFVVQHDALMRLSPSGLNTVRIVTQLNDANEVDILAARMRITIDSQVDNLAAGNAAAVIDIESGKLQGHAVFSDITKAPIEKHPITGVRFDGFQLPFWEDLIQCAQNAALKHVHNRSIGWDMAITPNGIDLIEANHDWCKLLWQLPAQRGLKDTLAKYSWK